MPLPQVEKLRAAVRTAKAEDVAAFRMIDWAVNALEVVDSADGALKSATNAARRDPAALQRAVETASAENVASRKAVETAAEVCGVF
jgi:hypothetical protein